MHTTQIKDNEESGYFIGNMFVNEVIKNKGKNKISQLNV